MENQPSTFKSAMNYGFIIGAVLTILSLISSIFRLYEASWVSWLTWIIFLVGIIWAIKSYRDKALGGYISFGKGLGMGTLTALFASIIVSFVSYLYLKFVDDSSLAFGLEKAEENMINQGMDDAQMSQALEMTKMFMTPGMIAVMGILSYTFFGFIFSLIASIFLKKEDPNSINL